MITDGPPFSAGQKRTLYASLTAITNPPRSLGQFMWRAVTPSSACRLKLDVYRSVIVGRGGLSSRRSQCGTTHRTVGSACSAAALGSHPAAGPSSPLPGPCCVPPMDRVRSLFFPQVEDESIAFNFTHIHTYMHIAPSRNLRNRRGHFQPNRRGVLQLQRVDLEQAL